MVLQARDARGSAGDLGTFSWDGFASDSGWVVGQASLRLSAGDEIVGRIPAATPVRGWRTQWAAVRNGTAGDPAAASDGVGRDVIVRPPAPGSWSLRLEVDFGEVGRASWYWRVEVEP